MLNMSVIAQPAIDSYLYDQVGDKDAIFPNPETEIEYVDESNPIGKMEDNLADKLTEKEILHCLIIITYLWNYWER